MRAVVKSSWRGILPVYNYQKHIHIVTRLHTTWGEIWFPEKSRLILFCILALLSLASDVIVFIMTFYLVHRRYCSQHAVEYSLHLITTQPKSYHIGSCGRDVPGNGLGQAYNAPYLQKGLYLFTCNLLRTSQSTKNLEQQTQASSTIPVFCQNLSASTLSTINFGLREFSLQNFDHHVIGERQQISISSTKMQISLKAFAFYYRQFRVMHNPPIWHKSLNLYPRISFFSGLPTWRFFFPSLPPHDEAFIFNHFRCFPFYKTGIPFSLLVEGP